MRGRHHHFVMFISRSFTNLKIQTAEKSFESREGFGSMEFIVGDYEIPGVFEKRGIRSLKTRFLTAGHRVSRYKFVAGVKLLYGLTNTGLGTADIRDDERLVTMEV